MTPDVLFAGIPVSDFARAADWYERLFDRPADVVAHATERLWQVTGSGWVYVVADPRRTGNGLVAIVVGDLDATVAELAARSIDVASTEQVPDGGRKATVTDPDGNQVAFIEVPGQAGQDTL
jgi:predicted enzyme related to lactoylglutathione lyase